MNIIPNPEVYRQAARYIHRRELTYTCHAVDKAVRLHYGEKGYAAVVAARSLYEQQYRAMFGPAAHAVSALDSLDQPQSVVDRVKAEDDYYGYQHPYWNKSGSRKMREARITTLLTMADIVENPNS